MALIECPECGKEISSSVKSCIHCGYKQEKYDKIGGWLILVIIGYIISFFSNISVIAGGYTLYLDGTMAELNTLSGLNYNPGLFSAINYEITLAIIMIIIITISGILMFKRKRIYPMYAIFLIIFSHFFVSLEVLVFGEVLDYTVEDISSIIGGIIGGIIWIIYFVKSKRVQQTFIK